MGVTTANTAMAAHDKRANTALHFGTMDIDQYWTGESGW